MPIYDTTNIAVTGIANSGKTVFLTSLFWHLDQYPAAHVNFTIGNKVTLGQMRLGGGKSTFEFEKMRANLANRLCWPRKTVDSAFFEVEFIRSDWRLKRQRLRFFDFPGERIADTAILLHPNYADWCDHLLKHFLTNPDFAPTINPYMEALHKVRNIDDAVHEYKRLLARQICQHEPLVSPSTFFLDHEGVRLQKKLPKDTPFNDREKLIEILAETGCAGAIGQEFCLIPKDIRNAQPAMTKIFETNYRAYRQTVVMPLFSEILKASKLLILVDIPGLLMGGDSRFNDDRKIIFDLLESLNPDSTFWRSVSRWFPWSKPLHDVIFVASKADMVHPDDVSQGKLVSLLKQMTTNAKSKMPHYQFDWFACSACRSSRPGDGDHLVKGILSYDNKERAFSEFPVTPLPATWPGRWNGKEFQYYELQPNVSNTVIHPPEQYQLDDIFNHLIGNK